jgi:CheY-like chemotaxis protein
VNQRLTARMLEKGGHRADLVDNGQETVAAVGMESYDLVLMDCHPPRALGQGAGSGAAPVGRGRR